MFAGILVFQIIHPCFNNLSYDRGKSSFLDHTPMCRMEYFGLIEVESSHSRLRKSMSYSLISHSLININRLLPCFCRFEHFFFLSIFCNTQIFGLYIFYNIRLLPCCIFFLPFKLSLDLGLKAICLGCIHIFCPKPLK
jgi:hypothetical protein